jgi:hypothetical protein
VPNEGTKVKWATIGAGSILDSAQHTAIEAAVRAAGGSAQWRHSDRAGRSYALLHFPHDAEAQASHAAELVRAAAAANGSVLYDSPVIALAVFPTVAEALPLLLSALGGEGRPAGVRACTPCENGGMVVAWDLERTPATIVLGVVDVELARFAAGRSVELLTPLAPHWIAQLAADGLGTPEISDDRILEALVRRAGLHV